ncbi:hypothetical protein ACF3DV_21410 [Chlorogloeopsis fritschii PCC 9212]|uniref:Uncharacterized protein n=1 Tax=Chlorogloeopsis fritschii PCC 6912 TaxID=211165 RepID=A0A433N2T2_CHLFR|nr:hypothetical protein [Chlorogloeopsis fritschii]RUR75463.1 hypothetical protein PCC6912_46940 [Chlorogloeopsis fritschii PCC 6912]
MPTTIQEICTQVIRTLTPAERLRLATLILNDLVQHDVGVVDQSDTWTEQDQLDLVAFSLQYAVTSYPENEELAE